MRKRTSAAALRLARAHGMFNLIGGLWPIVSLRSFEWVFGPKRDDWLQKTSGGLFAASGLVLLGVEPSTPALRAARTLGIATAATYLAIDLIYVPAGRLRKTYLLDAAMEIAWIRAWVRTRL